MTSGSLPGWLTPEGAAAAPITSARKTTGRLMMLVRRMVLLVVVKTVKYKCICVRERERQGATAETTIGRFFGAVIKSRWV